MRQGRFPRWASGALRASAAACLAVAIAGCVSLPPAPPPPSLPVSLQAVPRARENERVYLEAWGLVRDHYFSVAAVGEPWTSARDLHFPQAVLASDDRQLYGAINALLGELHDSHTAASPPREAKELRDERRARVGFYLVKIGGKWVVNGVVANGPAERAGVRPGWIFLSEDGVKSDGPLTFERAEGQVVTEEFLDGEDKPRTLHLTAVMLPLVPSPEERILEGGIVYLRFDDFEASTRRWLSERLKAHRDAPGCIVDLRQNLGGQVFSLDITLAEFFDHRVNVGVFTHRNGWRESDHSLPLFSAHYPGSVAVLVSSLSASSAEIFSRVLQVSGRAIIVGRKTAGAVRGSYLYPLSDGGSLQVSVLDYQAPDGKPLEGVGVTPDVPVELSLADLRAGIDTDIEAALLRLNPRGAASTQ